MLNTWLTLLPPVAVIIAAIVTRRIHPSLAIGIAIASIVAADGALYPAIQIGFIALWHTISSIDNLYLYGFLFGIGILVCLFTATGFAVSFAHSVTKKIRSARKAQYASMIVSFLLFIDDYLSILTAGYVMQPLIDHFRIAREKLAWLVHSFAGPIVILAPVSSWVATIIAYMDQAGIATTPSAATPIRVAADPFFIYLKSIPFMLYSCLTIISVWFVVHFRLSFGPMQQYEKEALIHTQTPLQPEPNVSMKNLLISLAVLVVGIAFGLPFAGGYYLFGGQYSLIESLKYNEHPFLVMFLAVLAAIAVTIAQALYKKLISAAQIGTIALNGFSLMLEAVTMVFLASTLSGLLANQVGTGQYLASILLHAIPLALLPVMFFIVSLLCTIATGSAWGNFALMIPIAIPMLTTLSHLPLPIDPQQLPLLLPVLGAIFSGSVCGDHISPLSETTIMTATSTGTTILTHAYTQIFYMIPAIISCIVGYFFIGFFATYLSLWSNISIACIISIFLCTILLWLANRHIIKKIL